MASSPAPPRYGAAAAILLITSLAGCASTAATNGADLAHDEARGVAAEIGSHSDSTDTLPIEEIVTEWVPETAFTAHGTATIEALAWSGRIDADSEATVDVRVHVTIDGKEASSIGDRTITPGEATVCYRLTWPLYEQATPEEIDCPSTAAPPRPTPPPHPTFTDADRARAAEIVAAAADPAALRTALTDAFPHDYVTVETTAWQSETVAAIGIPAERECILLARDATGTVISPSYDRIWLEPGETGCSTNLYTNPPL